MNRDGRAGSGSADAGMLLARCAQGDRTAFRVLYESQSPRLYGLAMRLLKQPALASDAVHDAFVQVWQRSARFDPALGHAEAWLTSLLRYRAIDILRRRQREVRDSDGREQPDQAPDPFALLSGRAEAAALQRCLELLEDRSRHAVQLAFLDGLTHSELAVRLQAPLGTVKSLVRRALLGLRRCLDA